MDEETIEVPYILPDGRPLASLNREESQVFLYGFEAAEMQQVFTSAKAIENMLKDLAVLRSEIKGKAVKKKIIPASMTTEQRKLATEELEEMYATFNKAAEVADEIKQVVFVKTNGQLKLPNVLALSKKVGALK